MVALTARLDPAAQTLTALHQQFSDTALSSIAGNVTRPGSNWPSPTRASPPGATWSASRRRIQTQLVDAVRAGEGALGQAQNAVDAKSTAAPTSKPRGRRPAGPHRRHPGRHRTRPPPSSWRRRALYRRRSEQARAAATSGRRRRPQQTAKPIRWAHSCAADRRRRRNWTACWPRSPISQEGRDAGTHAAAGDLDRADPGAGGVGLHRHPWRQHRPGGAHLLAEAQRQLEAAAAMQSTNHRPSPAPMGRLRWPQAQSLANSDVQRPQRAYAPQ